MKDNIDSWFPGDTIQHPVFLTKATVLLIGTDEVIAYSHHWKQIGCYSRKDLFALGIAKCSINLFTPGR